MVKSIDIEKKLRGRELDKREMPRCLQFLTKARWECTPLVEFAEQRRYIPKRNEDSITPVEESITWSNIVIVMIIHQSKKVDALLEAHFNTWLRRVGEGLDVVFVTDEDDTRELPDIVPKGVSKATFHLYKSNAEFDGKHIRFKVIDAYDYVSKLFHKDQNKKYYFKMDTDTYLLGENLIGYLNKLYAAIGDMPIHMGRLMFSHPDHCHTGGSFYGMSKKGFELTSKYFRAHPKVHEQEEIIYFRKGNKEASTNIMLHEDFMVSYAFHEATKIPSLFQFEFYQNIYTRDGVGTIDSPPITYHLLKTPDLIYLHHKLFFGENTPNDAPMRSHEEIQEEIENDTTHLKWIPNGGWVIAEK